MPGFLRRAWDWCLDIAMSLFIPDDTIVADIDPLTGQSMGTGSEG